MRALLLKRSKLWTYKKDTRINETYRIFRDILKKQYTYTNKTKDQKFAYFDTIKPEHILETLHVIDKNFDFNHKRQEGYFSEKYITKLMRFLHVDPDVDVLIVSRKEGVPAEPIILKNGLTYVLDSQSCINFNMIACKKGHEVCGITCKGKPYAFNGWIRSSENNSQALPCELMPYDWANNLEDFVINSEICAFENVNVNLKKGDMHFNFAKGSHNQLIYVLEQGNVHGSPKRNTPSPVIRSAKVYDPSCIRYIANNQEKLDSILANIKTLDDMDDEPFKHVIYTDFKKTAVALRKMLELELGMECIYTTEGQTIRRGAGKRFGYLVSGVVGDKKPLAVKTKKNVLNAFNARPGNIHGENVRIMILDGAYKEGIDLFDVKYVHIVEPPTSNSDLKQVIGRATRTCGQMGLDFVERVGWKLHVHIYDVTIPSVVAQRKGFKPSINTIHKLASSFVNSDARMTVLEDMISKNSADYKYNVAVNFPERKVATNVMNSKYTWGLPTPPIDMCNNRSSSEMTFTPSQKYVKDHLTPKSLGKGLLAIHSVGTGKTITAIASALCAFKEYTVLWVTRSSLKTDMKKDLVKFGIEGGKIGKFPPLSYKQFANLLDKKNQYYKDLVKINGDKDPLNKTFIIIDEAHKLISQDDLSAMERVDVSLLNAMIHNSYDLSNDESCKVLLMTATPIVNSIHDFFTLMNLLKVTKDQIVDPNALIDKKSPVLKAWIKSSVSYLDRSKDATQFAQPKIRFHFTKMTQRLSRLETNEEAKLFRAHATKFKYKHIFDDDYAKYKVDKSQEKLIEEKCILESNDF
jgi:hypothetical protein